MPVFEECLDASTKKTTFSIPNEQLFVRIGRYYHIARQIFMSYPPYLIYLVAILILPLDHNPLCRGTIFLCRTNVGWRCYYTSIHCALCCFYHHESLKTLSINLKVIYIFCIYTWIKKFLTIKRGSTIHKEYTFKR